MSDEGETKKRTRDSEGEDNDKSDSDGGFVGPAVPEAIKAKKRKVLAHEKLYLENLPCAESYERSYMHRDVILHCLVTATDFVVTASADGHIKFWKKSDKGVEFVKHFRSHLGTNYLPVYNRTFFKPNECHMVTHFYCKF